MDSLIDRGNEVVDIIVVVDVVVVISRINQAPQDGRNWKGRLTRVGT